MSNKNNDDTAFQHALAKLLTEVFDGPPGDWAYVLNPDDPGLLRQLESIDAGTASVPPAPGRTTIAAQVNHLRYSLALLNRWAAGEENPWTNADWNASWNRVSVTEDEWRQLREELSREVKSWQNTVNTRMDWNGIGAEGALASVVHAAYHLSAIRQILQSLR